MSSHPLILDANGDDIADLFGSSNDSKRSLWLFGPDREEGPEFVDLTERDEEDGVRLFELISQHFNFRPF